MKYTKKGKPISDGKTGEFLFERWAKDHGWIMERHQPPTKVVRRNGKVFTIQCKSTGIADYTGYERVYFGPQEFPMYRAAEVKEAFGYSMDCSRLDKDQRDWMAAIPWVSAYVAIAWMDGGNPHMEIFRYQREGSYKRGEGLIK